jgi:hypothetical protein
MGVLKPHPPSTHRMQAPAALTPLAACVTRAILGAPTAASQPSSVCLPEGLGNGGLPSLQVSVYPLPVPVCPPCFPGLGTCPFPPRGDLCTAGVCLPAKGRPVRWLPVLATGMVGSAADRRASQDGAQREARRPRSGSIVPVLDPLNAMLSGAQPSTGARSVLPDGPWALQLPANQQPPVPSGTEALPVGWSVMRPVPLARVAAQPGPASAMAPPQSRPAPLQLAPAVAQQVAVHEQAPPAAVPAAAFLLAPVGEAGALLQLAPAYFAASGANGLASPQAGTAAAPAAAPQQLSLLPAAGASRPPIEAPALPTAGHAEASSADVALAAPPGAAPAPSSVPMATVPGCKV